MFMLLLLKDLLTKFVISCTIKGQRATWLCLMEGTLASRDVSGVDNFRIRSDPNPNYANMEKSF
jgi:hypothetical protein